MKAILSGEGYGNEDEIRQMIAILLDNAIKNSDGKKPLKYNCMRSNGNIFIEVENSGKGIEEADLEHVFDRFYTTDKSRKRGSFGLGLAIAKSIVERHGGTISVESIPMEKTVFAVRF